MGPEIDPPIGRKCDSAGPGRFVAPGMVSGVFFYRFFGLFFAGAKDTLAGAKDTLALVLRIRCTGAKDTLHWC